MGSNPQFQTAMFLMALLKVCVAEATGSALEEEFEDKESPKGKARDLESKIMMAQEQVLQHTTEQNIADRIQS